MFDKGIQVTFKLDDEQVKQITELVLGYLKKAKDDISKDFDDVDKELDSIKKKIGMLSP